MAQAPLGIALGNFLLALEAFGSKFPNVMSKKMDSWNGRWVIRVGQVINVGREKGFFNLAAVMSVNDNPNQPYNEDMRDEVKNILTKGIALEGNLQTVMQTVVDIHGALPGMVLDKGVGQAKDVVDVLAKGWIKKLEKAKSYVENANKLRNNYSAWGSGGVHTAVAEYTLFL